MPLYEKSGVEKANNEMIPRGTEVHNIQGLNLPHLELVLSAIAPIIGLNEKAAIKPTVKIMKDESSDVSP